RDREDLGPVLAPLGRDVLAEGRCGAELDVELPGAAEDQVVLVPAVVEPAVAAAGAGLEVERHAVGLDEATAVPGRLGDAVVEAAEALVLVAAGGEEVVEIAELVVALGRRHELLRRGLLLVRGVERLEVEAVAPAPAL